MARQNARQRSRQRVDPETKLTREIRKMNILPTVQVRQGDFMVVDVSNHSDADQRHMVRSGERKTIRRKPKIDTLRDAGIINTMEALACEWYAKAFALRYETSGITAAYGLAGASSRQNYDHLPKTREQEDAYHHFHYARQAISPHFLPTFERVVLYGWPLGKASMIFKTAAKQLLGHIEGRVEL